MDCTKSEKELTRHFENANDDDSNKVEQPKQDNHEFPNVVGSNQEVQSDRITYTRKELIDKFIEVEKAPSSLYTNLKDNKVIGLGKHMLSDYTIRPVACDKHPFSITHINPYNKAQ